VVKEIADETLNIVVPGMLLQPLIENSIKHGLEPRISGGTVTLRSRITAEGRLMIEVEDDGVGMLVERDDAAPVSGLVQPGTGIGMRNVRERMAVLYGALAAVEINSRPGRGTKVTLLMPILDAGAETWGPFGGAAGQAIGDMVRGAARAMTQP
jgi:two-component system, LytTR family, sensor kinase